MTTFLIVLGSVIVGVILGACTLLYLFAKAWKL